MATLRAWLDGPADVRLVVETSGSSGAPKRVVLTRDAVLASVALTSRRLGAAGRWVLVLPPTYVAGVQVIVRSLVAGHEPATTWVSTSSTSEGRSITDVWFTSLVPTQLLRMLDRPAEVAALRAAHTVLLGGGPIDPRLRERAADAGIRTVATYGSVETAGGCVYDGLPLDGVDLAIDDDGRIQVRGPMLFEGYADDAAATSEVLVDGWYLTSDLGHLDDEGRLHVLGRIDDVVLSGGVNVPAPVVARRLREHPEVVAAEVIGVDDDEWGRRVVAFLVGPLDAAEARDWVAAVHPRAWAPRQVVALDELPLLANGKPDRERLRALA